MSAILRQVARSVPRTRAFATSAVARKDLVQDIYLREIKAYKPAPAAKDAHVGAVKKFALPPSPKAPALPADLASELSAYDATEPTLAESSSTASSASTGASEEPAGTGADAYLAFLEQDLPKPVAHH